MRDEVSALFRELVDLLDDGHHSQPNSHSNPLDGHKSAHVTSRDGATLTSLCQNAGIRFGPYV